MKKEEIIALKEVFKIWLKAFFIWTPIIIMSLILLESSFEISKMKELYFNIDKNSIMIISFIIFFIEFNFYLFNKERIKKVILRNNFK